MRIAVAQVDAIAGDIRGNASRVLTAMEQAEALGADLCVFPELVVVGYAPYDLLQRPELASAAREATRVIAGETGEMAVILGTVDRGRPGPGGYPLLQNTAALCQKGRVVATRAKTLIPTYDVFHEGRHFSSEPIGEPIGVGDRHVGLLICEDMWDAPYATHPPAALVEAGADLLICLSASPYRQGVARLRLRHARGSGCPLLYVNGVGGQDELIFDGGSFALDAEGRVRSRLPRFREAVEVMTFDGETLPEPEPEGIEELFEALCLGLRAFADKNGIRDVFVGLSGGIDSALVACLAAEALGPKRVRALALPSRFTDPRSTDTARELAENLGIGFEVLSIETLHEAARETLGPLLSGPPEQVGTTGENLQARLRCVLLMAYVNRFRGMLLNTSNKTELALGYSTLYGDMAGGLSPLGDLTKTRVRQMAAWIQETRGTIPEFILSRPPTAELKANQVDPFDYARIAPIVEGLVSGRSREELRLEGATTEELDRFDRMIRRAEHKRHQFPPILKVTPKAFGRGRLVPITHRHVR